VDPLDDWEREVICAEGVEEVGMGDSIEEAGYVKG